MQQHFYPFSSVPFYTGIDPLLLNGKRHNLDYGAAAPGAPDVFLTDAQFDSLWKTCDRCYYVASEQEATRIEALVGQDYFRTLASSGGSSC